MVVYLLVRLTAVAPSKLRQLHDGGGEDAGSRVRARRKRRGRTTVALAGHLTMTIAGVSSASLSSICDGVDCGDGTAGQLGILDMGLTPRQWDLRPGRCSSTGRATYMWG